MFVPVLERLLLKPLFTIPERCHWPAVFDWRGKADIDLRGLPGAFKTTTHQARREVTQENQTENQEQSNQYHLFLANQLRFFWWCSDLTSSFPISHGLSIFTLYQFQISAQESRRKKKEYMDCLEKRMNRLASDLEEYKVKCSNLESHNSSLLSHIRTLREQLAKKQANSS